MIVIHLELVYSREQKYRHIKEPKICTHDLNVETIRACINIFRTLTVSIFVCMIDSPHSTCLAAAK